MSNATKLRTTVMLDPQLMEAARVALQSPSNSNAIEQALRLVVKREAINRLIGWVWNSDPEFTAAPRRRP